MTLSIGFCYSFSLFVTEISKYTGYSISIIQFIFCLNIFFLGMGASFFGRVVEKNIKMASIISTILLISGFIIGGIGVNLKSLPLLYIGLGVFCGLSEGCGYVVPVKNLILWFKNAKNKGAIMAISIISFGLGSTICSYLYRLLFPIFGITNIFFILSVIYIIPMVIATLVIAKPKYCSSKIKYFQSIGLKSIIKDGFFKKAWIFMFLNISMGLILIGSCAIILKQIGLCTNTIITVMMFCGIMNGVGRLIFPAISDYMSKKYVIWIVILLVEILMVMLSYISIPMVIATFLIINATYGAGFSTLPNVIYSHYGTDNLSEIHGYILSAWGFASLFAYLCICIINHFGGGHYLIFSILLVMYTINLLNTITIKNNNHGH